MRKYVQHPTSFGRVEVDGPLRGMGFGQYESFTEEEFIRRFNRLYRSSEGQDVFDTFLDNMYIVESYREE